MIYLFVDKSVSPDHIQTAINAWKMMKGQVKFLLGPDGDEVLKNASGLEEYEYLFSLEKDLFHRLIDLRFEIEPDSLIIKDLTIPLARIFRFQEAIYEAPAKTDFYQLIDIDRIDGAMFITKLGYNRLWSISAGHQVKESHFRWVNLDPDSCLNLTQEKGENSPIIE
ncbi:MAG: hypothetical protein KDD37_01835 [Bdellovibrionales bacterium]|nr:hypothetical protein [Bdellovibrionales bacterium]